MTATATPEYSLRHPGGGEIWLYVGDHPAQLIGTVTDHRYRDEFITSYNQSHRQPAVAGEGLTIPRATLQTWWNKLLANGPEANNWDTGKLLEVADAIRELLDATPSPPPADAGDARDYDARTFTLLWNECILKEVHDTKALEGIVTRFNCCLANPIYAHKPVDAGRERVRFEAWAATELSGGFERTSSNVVSYVNDDTELAWVSWCAALRVKP